jgi:hypothetical protein
MNITAQKRDRAKTRQPLFEYGNPVRAHQHLKLSLESYIREECAMRLIAAIILSLMAVAPASAQYAALRPKGAVPLLNGCQGMMGYPDCHPQRTYMGPAMPGTAHARVPRTARVYPPRARFYPAR